MFTPEELEFMPRKIEKLYSDLEWRIMMDIVRRLQMAGEITRSADWQIYRLSELGKSKKEIKKFIREILSLTEKEMDKIYEETIASGYARNQALYEAVGKEFIPYTENMVLQQMVQAIKTQTLDQLQNITQSMGFARKVNGKIEFTELADFYQKTLDNAVLDITSGAFDYNTVLRRTIDTMTESGLRSVDYASGWSNRVEVAARRALMTGVSQVTGRIHEQNAKKLGIDMYEVTRHRGARPDHCTWQGKCFNMEELKSICGYGKVDGLKGANCYHDFHVFFPGISKRIYTDEELDRLNAEENIPKEWHGKEYTAYEATQKQRRMETTIRAQKRKINLLEEGGADPDTITAAKCRWRKKMGDYVDFSETMKLPEQRERLYVGKIQKNIVNNTESGILKEEKTHEEKKMAEIQQLGRLNLSKLEPEFGKIQTDEIIITNERIEHIKFRHPEDYEYFEKYGQQSILDPDVIIKDTENEGTVFMVKCLPETNLNVIVRLVLENDDSKLKNSVMTFYRIRNRNLKKLMEKHKVLYKKE